MGERYQGPGWIKKAAVMVALIGIPLLSLILLAEFVDADL